MATSEEIFAFKTTGLSEVLNAYRQIEQAQKAIEDTSIEVAKSLKDQVTAQKQLATVAREVRSANLDAASSYQRLRGELSQHLVLERQLALEIRNRNAALRERVTLQPIDPAKFDESIGKSLEESITGSIEKGFRNAQKGNFLGTIGSIVSAPFSAIGSVASSVTSGLGFALTQSIVDPIGKNFGKGLSTALETSLSKSVGSSELFAEKVGGAIATSIASGVASTLQRVGTGIPEILEEQISKIDDKALRRKIESVLEGVRNAPRTLRTAITDTIGAEAIQTEGLFQRGQNVQRVQAKKPTAQEQAVKEYRDSLDRTAKLEEEATRRISALDQAISTRQKEFNDAQNRYNQIANQLADARASGQAGSAIENLAAALNVAGTDLERLSNTLLALNKARKISEQAVTEAKAQSGQARAVLDQQLPQAQPKAFEDLARIVLKDNFNPEKLPKLVVADDYLDQRNAESIYNVAKNQIFVTQQMLEAIQKGTLDEKQLIVLAEELAHADDLAFGSAKGISARKQNRITTTPVVPTKEELQQLAPELGRYASIDQRNIELNAKVRALRAAEEFQAQQNRTSALSDIADTARAGEVLPERKAIFDRSIETLKKRAEKLGVDVTETVEGYTKQFSELSVYIEQISAKAIDNADTANTELAGKLKKAATLATTKIEAVQRGVDQATQDLRSEFRVPFNPTKQADRVPVETNAISRREETAQPTLRDRVADFGARVRDAADNAAEAYQKTSSIIRQVGQKLEQPTAITVKALGYTGKALYGLGKGTYKALEAVEDFALDILPAGKGVKKLTQTVILPAAGVAALSALNPAVGQAVGSATGAASSALAPIAQGAASGLPAQIASFVPDVFGAQAAVAAKLTGSLDLIIEGGTLLIAKAGVSSVAGGAVRVAVKRVGNVIKEGVEEILDRATGDATQAKIDRQTRKARAANKGAIEVSATPVTEKFEPVEAKQIAPVANPQDRTNAAISEIQKLDAQFSAAYQSLKKAIKAENAQIVNAYESVIKETVAQANADIDKLIAELKASGDKSGAIGKLAGVKGRISQKTGLVDKQIAKFRKDQELQGKDLDAQALDLSVGFGQFDQGLEALRKTARSAANALNGAIAAFAEVEKQAKLTDTLKSAATSPKVQGVAKDLAVNTAGFAASQAAGQFGTVADLGADFTGAIVARQALNASLPFAQAYLALRKSVEFQQATNAQKLKQIQALVVQYRVDEKKQAEELYGDITGFIVGNAAKFAGSAVGANIPLRGAIAASAAVPQLQKLRDRIQSSTRSQSPDIALGEDLNAQALKPGQALKELNSRRKQLLELLEQQIGNYIDELGLRLKGQPDLIDNAKVSRTLTRFNQLVTRLTSDRMDIVDRISEEQFNQLIKSQQAIIDRQRSRGFEGRKSGITSEYRGIDLTQVADDALQNENQEVLRQAQKTTRALQRQIYDQARKGLIDLEGDLPLLRVEEPAERSSFVKEAKLFYGRLSADIQENVRRRYAVILGDSRNLSNDLSVSAISATQQGDVEQGAKLSALNQRLVSAQQEAQQILIKPRVEVSDRDLSRLQQLENDIKDVYNALNLTPPGGGNFGGILDGIESADRSLKGFKANIAGVAGALVGLGAQFAAQQAALATFRQATQTFREFANYDQQLRTFGVVTQASGQQVTALRTEVERLATSTTKGNKEIAGAAIELAKQGFSAEETTKALNGVVLSSVASGETLADTAKVIGVALNQFQLGASESVRISDLLTQASNTSATGTARLGESLKYVGGQAKASNQSAEETITVLALMAASGLDASSAGTGLAEALKRVKNASAQASTELEELKGRGSKQAVAAFNLLNQEVRDSNGNLLPFTQILGKVKKSLQDFPKQEQELILSALFGVQGSRAVLSVIGQTDEKIQKTITGMQQFQGASKKAGDELTKGAFGALEQFNGGLENLRLNAGKTAAIAFVPLLNAANGLFDAFGKLPEPVQQFLIATGGLGTTIAAGTIAIAAFQVANASFIGTILRSAAAIGAEVAAFVARNVAVNAATVAQALFTTQVTASSVKLAALTVAQKAGAAATALFAGATGVATAAMGTATTAAGALGTALQLALAPLAVLGAGVAITGLVKLTEQIADTTNRLNELYATTNAATAGAPQAIGRLVSAQKQLNDAKEKGRTLTEAEKKNAKDSISNANQQLDILKQQLAQAEAVPEAQAGLLGVGKDEADAQNRARAANIRGIKDQIAALERNRDALQKGLATDNVKAIATKKQTELNDKLIKSIKDQLTLGKITEQEAINELTSLSNNEKAKEGVRANAKRAIEQIRKGEVKDAKTAADEALKARQAGIDAEIGAIQASQAEIEASQAEGRLTEAQADRELTDLKIAEIRKRIDAQKAIQELGTDEDRKKAVAEEAKLQSEIAKVQAEFRKRERERRLQDIIKASQEAEAAIKQSQTAQIIAQKEAELSALKATGADRERIERDAQNKISQIQLQGTSQEIAAKQKALAEIRAARAQGTVDAKSAADQERQLIEQIGQLTINRLDAEKARLEQLRQEKLKQIELDLKRATQPLDTQAQRLQLENSLLQQQNNLVSARQNLDQALTNLQQQRLQFALEDAKAAGNATLAAQIQDRLFASQAAALERQLAYKLQALDLSERQKNNELRIAELKETIAVKEAEAAIRRAEAEGRNQEEIAFLREALQLRRESLGLIQQQQQDQSALNQIARDALNAEQQAAREKQQRDQQQARKDSTGSSGGVGGSGASSGGVGSGRTLRSMRLEGEDLRQYNSARSQLDRIVASSGGDRGRLQASIGDALASGTLNDKEKDFLAMLASDLNLISGSAASTARKLDDLGISSLTLDSELDAVRDGSKTLDDVLNQLAGNAKTASSNLGGIPQIKARKDGGSIVAGQSYLVGEEGAELITPTRNGFVHNAIATQNLLAGSLPRDIATQHNLPGDVTMLQDGSLLKEVQRLNSRIDDLVNKAAYPRTLVLQGSELTPVSAAKTWAELSKQKIQRGRL